MQFNYHFNITSQIIRLFSRNNFVKSLFQNSQFDGTIVSDISHGNIYRDFLKTQNGEFLKNKQGFTFILNTDGVQISLKSTLSIWPVYLVINELPKHERFKFHNILIAGTFFFIKNFINKLLIYLFLNYQD